MANREECRTIVRQLWPFLDGALPDELKERVAEHLEGCTACRSHFDFEREFLAAVRLHGAAAPDGDFERLGRRVLQALGERGFSATGGE